MGSHERRGAKIVATLGPASAERATIRAMVEAGLDVARLNFSHGDHRALRALIAHVRAVQAESDKPLAIVGDLRGPKIRLGPLPEPIALASGSQLRISMAAGHAGPATVSCDYAGLADDVRAGDSIFLRDGAIELEVTGVANESDGKTVETLVRSAGTLTSRAGVNVPGVRVRLPALTANDQADIRFAVAEGIDYLALSFVRRPEDMREARSVLQSLGSDVELIAKIESAQALENLDAILHQADGVMVARGDLAVEIGPENVPIRQRGIVAAAADRLVPVIIATQMLESMVENARPTRAEASDVANAIWDGADAVMLSAETAVGKHPVESVAMMDRIARRAEESEGARRAPTVETDWGRDPSRSISWAARSIVQQNPSVRAVIAFTVSGYTARLIAKDHMGVPVVVLAPTPPVEQRAALLWGVTPARCDPPSDLATMLRAVDDVAREQLDCTDGDLVVVVGGVPLGQGKPTNFLKLHPIGEGF